MSNSPSARRSLPPRRTGRLPHATALSLVLGERGAHGSCDPIAAIMVESLYVATPRSGNSKLGPLGQRAPAPLQRVHKGKERRLERGDQHAE